jgi:hypothetical protein
MDDSFTIVETYIKHPKEVETTNQLCSLGKKPMILQHDNATTSAAIQSIIYQVVPHFPYCPDLVCLTSGCLKLSRNMSKEFISHVMEFKLLWENGFEKSQKSFTVTGSKNLFTTSDVVSNDMETTWKNKVQKQGTHFGLYFVLCFILMAYLGLRHKHGCITL